MKNKETISIPKYVITDIIAEMRVLDVALYRFSQEAINKSASVDGDVGQYFAALFAEHRMGERIAFIRASFLDYLLDNGNINDSDLDEIDAHCASRLLKDFNIQY